jgi:hypothetical protein
VRDALPEVWAVTVAKLDGLVSAGRGAGRDGGATPRARLERDVDLDRRITAGIEDLPRPDAGDGRRQRSPFARS